MKQRQVLDVYRRSLEGVIVDHLPSVGNVPRSVSSEGHEALEMARVNATDWATTIQKRGDG